MKESAICRELCKANNDDSSSLDKRKDLEMLVKMIGGC